MYYFLINTFKFHEGKLKWMQSYPLKREGKNDKFGLTNLSPDSNTKKWVLKTKIDFIFLQVISLGFEGKEKKDD